jgi:hypothetical protein
MLGENGQRNEESEGEESEQGKVGSLQGNGNALQKGAKNCPESENLKDTRAKKPVKGLSSEVWIPAEVERGSVESANLKMTGVGTAMREGEKR